MVSMMLKRLYDAIWVKSPPRVRSVMSRTAFVVSNRPRYVPRPADRMLELDDGVVTLLPFPEGRRAALIFSADFELAWAWRYAASGSGSPDVIGLRGRRNVPTVLDVFGRYNVPITWAAVGHLCLASCHRRGGRPHPEMRRIPYFVNHVWSFQTGDWYDHDPCTSAENAPAWYAPDLVAAILDSDAGHELGCHTFSHIDFTDVRCPDGVALDEIRACRDAFASFGVVPRSMVFPGGTHGHYALLAQEGFTCVRRQIREGVELFYPVRHESGLWVLPSSAPLDSQGMGWDACYVVRRLRKYIDRAIEHGLVCHLWFHPSLLDESIMEEVLPDLLAYASRKRDSGELWLATMRQVADYCECVSRVQVLQSSKAHRDVVLDIDRGRFRPVDIWAKRTHTGQTEAMSRLGGNDELRVLKTG